MADSRLQIAIGVGGRFHADRMARALLDGGYDVQLFTSLPRNRFPGLDRASVRSFLIPEIVFRGARKLGLEMPGAVYKMRGFGRRMARELHGAATDLTITWSSFGLETLEHRSARKVVVRDSAHIEFQVETLDREYAKVGARFPDHRAVIARERREYALADSILLLSEFARRTFIERGVDPAKLRVVHLGADLSLFRPAATPRTGGPVRVLYFGTLSIQKGVHYLLEAVRRFSATELELTLVGAVEPEFQPILARFPHVRVHAPMPHPALADFVREHDVFVLPSLHDGFGMVVPQAMASGLVPIVSDHAGAAELVHHGENGFLVPAANAEALGECLGRCVQQPARLAEMRAHIRTGLHALDWRTYESNIRAWVAETLARPISAAA